MEKISVKYTPKSNDTFTAHDLAGALKMRMATSEFRDKFNLVLDRESAIWIKDDVLKKVKKGTVEVSPTALEDKHAAANEVTFFVKQGKEFVKAGQMIVTLEKPAPVEEPTDWPANVVCAAAFATVDKGVRTKAMEIAASGGRGSHGAVVIAAGSIRCQHWTVGSTMRIFGTFTGGVLTIIGWGPHGNTDSSYVVTLAAGGRPTTAQTA